MVASSLGRLGGVAKSMLDERCASLLQLEGMYSKCALAYLQLCNSLYLLLPDPSKKASREAIEYAKKTCEAVFGTYAHSDFH